MGLLRALKMCRRRTSSVKTANGHAEKEMSAAKVPWGAGASEMCRFSTMPVNQANAGI